MMCVVHGCDADAVDSIHRVHSQIDALEKKLEDVAKSFRDRNELAMTKILVFFAPWATAAAGLYVLDRISVRLSQCCFCLH